VTATDPSGASGTAEIEIEVEDPPANQPPSVRALADPPSGTAPLRVRLTAAATDVEDGSDVLLVWDFGDGGRGAGEGVWHTYAAPGVYDATVTATDRGGATGTATVRVTVTGSGGVQQQPLPGNGSQGDVAGEAESLPGVRIGRRHSLGRVVRRGLRYTVSCFEACRVTAVLMKGDRRLGRLATRRIAAGDARRLVLRLDRSDRLRLRSSRRVTATLVTTIRTAELTRIVRKRVVLRR
jgi:hypothetical protein